MNYVKFIQFRNYKFTSKVVNKTNDILYKVQNFETPEKLKGTFLERWGKYWKNLFTDYKEVTVSVVNDCKEHPIKASIYASVLAFCIYLNKHNPDESSFREQLLQNTIKIMQVGETVRNPVSEYHVKWLGQCYNEGIVRRMNLDVQYATFYQRIVDFGILDKWWVLESKMKDYDVNETEFSDLKTE
ncbi:mitochondrial import inner membrane translocase subunit Tim29 isoform X2 [Osmia lignaria lignaria]|uniref:mitochondrial import inner membrane translocase subunit Tim29 isoform X2 n=1 Tax=Osmia lignaria lignaria TaxID=1437193 RepID=UPI001478FBA4|nr:mitochondrial import inner membrane translocase subunit Tim29 isoform X2 [Osmia lignaria]